MAEARGKMSLMLRGSSFQEKTIIYYKSIFNKYDENKDGYLGGSELQNMVKSDPNLLELRESLVEKLYKHDKNRDEKIDFAEFTEMIEDPELNHVFGNFLDIYTNFVVPYGRSKPANYYRECSCHPYPLGIITISLIEIIFFLLDKYMVVNSIETLFSFKYTQRSELWRFVSYMLVHKDVLHLITNVAIQLLLGIALEMVHKWWRVLILYFTGVLAGTLAMSVLFTCNDLIGASGGVYALITAHMASILMNWKEFHHPAIQFLVFLIFVFFDFAMAVYEWNGDRRTDMGFMAHMGGAVAGLLLGINILRNLVKTKNEKIMWWISLVTFMFLATFSVFWNIYKGAVCNTNYNNFTSNHTGS